MRNHQRVGGEGRKVGVVDGDSVREGMDVGESRGGRVWRVNVRGWGEGEGRGGVRVAKWG